MIGILGCLSDKASLVTDYFDYFNGSPFLEDTYKQGNFKITRKLNDKFKDDKVFQDDNRYFIAIDGAILNLKQLLNHYAQKNTFELIRYLFEKNGSDFINELKGSFSLVLFEKLTNSLVIFTDITTSKPIYYHYNSETSEFYFASNAYHLAMMLKENAIKLTVNKFAFYSVAAYGYVYGNHHFTNEIKKIRGGEFIRFDSNNGINIQSYFKLHSFPQTKLTPLQLIGRLDEYFEEAIDLQFSKNEDNDYRQLCNLSGGLDSRMTTCIGHFMGYKDIDAITFSASGYWDEIISKQITSKFRFNHRIFTISDNSFLKEFEKSIKITGGLLSYYVTNQVFELYDNMDFKDYGILNSGHVGDAIVGNTLHKFTNHFKYGLVQPSYMNNYSQIEEELNHEHSINETLELSRFNNHVNNFTMQGVQFTSIFAETVSPFLYRDFIAFCLRIPLAFRNNHKLYYKWIASCYPQLGKFYYEKTKKRTLNISYKNLRNVHDNVYKLYLKSKGLKLKHNALLPYEKWRHENSLENYLTKIFFEKLNLIDDHNLQADLDMQFKSKNFQIKLKALHALLTYELYFCN